MSPSIFVLRNIFNIVHFSTVSPKLLQSDRRQSAFVLAVTINPDEAQTALFKDPVRTAL